MRLYVVPGMNHCQGGVGPDQFNKISPSWNSEGANRTRRLEPGSRRARHERQRGYDAAALPLSAGRRFQECRAAPMTLPASRAKRRRKSRSGDDASTFAHKQGCVSRALLFLALRNDVRRRPLDP